MFQYNSYLSYELEQGLVNKRKQLEMVDAELERAVNFTLVAKKRGNRVYYYANTRVANKVKSIYVHESDLEVLKNEKERLDGLRIRKARIKKEIEELNNVLHAKKKTYSDLGLPLMSILKDEKERQLKRLERLQADLVRCLSQNIFEEAKEKKAEYDRCFLAIEEINEIIGGKEYIE